MLANPDPLGLGALRRHARVTATAERLPELLDPILRRRRWRQHRLVRRALADPAFTGRFAADGRLPAQYGVGVDERAVEYPWLYAQRPYGRLLDAGSVLNRADILDRFLPEADELHIVTLAPEQRSYPNRGVSYVYADIRELPYADDTFDTVVCASTLEHVGMDNSQYAPGVHREDEPPREVDRAVRELCRVTAPGGLLLVTVPFGARNDHGWLLQFDGDALDRLVESADADEAATTFFRYTRDGWQRSTREEAAGSRYRDPTDEPRPSDLAACARAVACVTLTIR